MKVCISCKGEDFKRTKRIEELNSSLVRCLRCGLLFLSPVPEADKITSLYQGNFYNKEGAVRFKPLFEKIIFLHRWFRSKRLQKLVRKGVILDIGFSRGLTLYLLKKRGWDAFGTQLSHHAIENARTELGLEVYEGDLKDQHLEPEKFDIVTLWHVLEHLRSPDQYLKEIHGILRKHGTMVLEVPNLSSPIARFFGDHWFGLDLPHHLYNFTEDSLTYLLERCGFKVFRKTYFSFEHSPFSLLQSILNFLSRDRNLLFESLKGHNLIFQRPFFKKIFHVAAATILIVPVTLLAFVGGLLRKGDIVTFYCEKLDNK